MHAGVTTFQIQPNMIDELVTIIRDSMVPAIAGRGLLSTLVLTGRNIEKAVLIGDWETETQATNIAASGVVGQCHGVNEYY